MNRQPSRFSTVLAAVLLGVVSSVEANVELSAKTQALLAAPVRCRPVQGALGPAGVVTIKPGHVYCFRVTTKSNQVTLTQASASDDPAKMLTVRLFREGTTQDHFLYVKNGTASVLKYHASIRATGGGPFANTSTCPVPPGAAALEHWPFIVTELKISAVDLLKSLDETSCD